MDPDAAHSFGGGELPEAVEVQVIEICMSEPAVDLASFEQAAVRRAEALRELRKQHPKHIAGIDAFARRLVKGEELLSPLRGFEGNDAPEQVGPYRVVKPLGQGAFGIVLLAEQSSPVARQVAVKLMLPGIVTQQTLARFDAERQALATMTHPGIAQIFDAGMTEDNRPYFVMEYVQGQTVTRYCDEGQLDLRVRVSLMQEVCAAVQHAHQRGFIHRDLKPTNVLVTELDGKAVPKVIDFGIAKALNRDVGSNGFETRAGHLVGSPLYMSPEQARGDTDGTDTRSDVYSLGVLLYEILVGELPFQLDASSPTPATIRELHDSEAVRPSSRIDPQVEEWVDTASRRGVTPKKLSDTLRGELDAIVLTAIDRDPERRYQSTSALAQDLGRYLDGHVVLARPPSARYRLGKFLRRYRVQVGAALLVALALVVGSVSTLVFAFGEREQARLAGAAAAEAEENLQKFHQLAIGARVERAEAMLADLKPAWPSKLPALRRWQANHGEPLAAELPSLLAALSKLRERALPYTEADRSQSLANHPLSVQLQQQEEKVAYLEAQLAEPIDMPQWEEVKAQLEGRLADFIATRDRLRSQQKPRTLFRFANPGDQFLHNTLTALVERLHVFVGAVNGATARVQRRVDGALNLQSRMLGLDADAWILARTELAADPRFASIELQPQAGLVPLGADPDSGLQEFYHWESSAIARVPQRDAAGVLDLHEASGQIFVLLPGGEFMMGAQNQDDAKPNFDTLAAAAELPVHSLRLDPFFLSKFEATKAQWFRLGGARVSYWREGTVFSGGVVTGRYPVENVSWDAAHDLLANYGLTLPTEAQWEYGCRAGTTTPWPTGSKPESLEGYVNLADLAAAKFTQKFTCDAYFNDGFPNIAPVGRFEANAFGVHDMIGNVGEWCFDYYGSFTHRCATRPGDCMRLLPDLSWRAARLSSFATQAARARSSERFGMAPQARESTVGVRAARPLEL